MNWHNKTLQTKHIMIQVTNKHIYARGVWVMHVREFGWNTKPIGVPNESTEEEAQIAAIETVRQRLNEMIESLHSPTQGATENQ